MAELLQGLPCYNTDNFSRLSGCKTNSIKSYIKFRSDDNTTAQVIKPDTTNLLLRALEKNSRIKKESNQSRKREAVNNLSSSNPKAAKLDSQYVSFNYTYKP
ncbi:DET1- and DDB1-associated protein 1-like [Dysidea avara]|uniref:DET1- and DDB1-associated protein 1-like n=1 Tax=Dysidea avara TaxID=196820 RepID=UPI00331C1DC2